MEPSKVQWYWYHLKAVVIAGMSFFTYAYNLFCISFVTKLLGRTYYDVDGSPEPGRLPSNVAAAINVITLFGTLAGLFFFRRLLSINVTLVVMIVSSIFSGLSFGAYRNAVVATLCFFRFGLGFGIGGDLTFSITTMAKYYSRGTCGSFIAAVFAMQSFGILAGGTVAMLVSRTCTSTDFAWRIILMFGALPTALTFYCRGKLSATLTDLSRMTVPEKPHCKKATNQQTEHGLHLIGMALLRFFVDFTYYSNNLFQNDVFSAIGWLPVGNTMSAVDELFKISLAQILIALCGIISGYFFTVALIDRVGGFVLQTLGFFFITVFMFALAIPYHHWTRPQNHVGFMVIYGLTFFFSNFGPNATSFIIPAEYFPTRFRSTCHGMAAAAGNVGAILSAFGFLYVGFVTRKLPIMVGVTNLLGLVLSLLFLWSTRNSTQRGGRRGSAEKSAVTNKIPYCKVISKGNFWSRKDKVSYFYKDSGDVIVNRKGEITGSTITSPIGKEGADVLSEPLFRTDHLVFSNSKTMDIRRRRSSRRNCRVYYDEQDWILLSSFHVKRVSFRLFFFLFWTFCCL